MLTGFPPERGLDMGRTIIQKIIGAHSDQQPEEGSVVWMDIDVRSARDFGGANVVNNFLKWYPGEKVADPEKTFFTFDCVVPANNIPYANNQQTCRVFARGQAIKVHDCERGIGSHVDIEEGLAVPGAIVVGTDSHLNILGAVGAFGQGMGDQDIAFAFKAGKTWFEVPRTMKITLKGRRPANTTAKDLTLFLVGRLGSKGALGRSVEFYGEEIDALPLSERITLASMATEMGAIIAFLPPNEAVLQYCRERSGNPELQGVYADPDASYVEELEFDISGLTPQIARPPKPDNVVPVAEVRGQKVDTVFIGSCTNGSYDDISAVARLVEGKKVAPGVQARVVPATREVYAKMLENGQLSVLFQAGFNITAPGCGGCASGQVGMTGDGEVQISTSNRNFAGKQGAGQTYLASPLTAAACSILGRIGTADEIQEVGA